MAQKANKKVGIIIQARFGSERLLGKVLQEVSGKPMLWHIVERLKMAKNADDVILAIPDDKTNDCLENFAKENSIKYFRGSENNVLSRFIGASKEYNLDVLVRICADDPMIDPKIVDSMIEKHLAMAADCTSNVVERTFPRGLDVEVINFEVLEKIYKEAKGNHFTEHVTPYIYFHPEIFKIQKVKAEGKLCRPELKWAVDEEKDLEMVREVYKNMYQPGKMFYSEELIDFLDLHPEIKKMNEDVKQKSHWDKIS